jgi:hypothetical protein
LSVLLLLLGFSGVASAGLMTIGTATYGGNEYKLIYEDDVRLVWLDYTKDYDDWQAQVNWAAGFNAGGVLTYKWNPGVSVTWGGDWRLPSTVDGVAVYGYEGDPNKDGVYNYTYGYNLANSEMGHLYYTSLGNLGYVATNGTNPQSGWGLKNTSPFSNLQADFYWSGTEYSPNPGLAWYFLFHGGFQDFVDKGSIPDFLIWRPVPRTH